MHPYLFVYRSILIPTYAVCFILAFAAVTVWAGYRARSARLDPNVCISLLLWVVPFSLAGARLFSIAQRLLYSDRLHLDRIWFWKRLLFGSGMIAYGGVIVGIITAYIFMKRRKLDFLAYADVYAPALGLGICIMRMGCFFAGCCWGKGDFTALTVDFPQGGYAGFYQHQHGFHGLFPTQLLAALDGLAIMAALLFLEKRIRTTGYAFFLFIILYAAARVGEDLTRFYPDSDRAFVLTYNQWISAGMVCFAGYRMILLMARRTPAAQLDRRIAKGIAR